MPPKKKATRRKKKAAGSTGLTPAEVGAEERPSEVEALAERVAGAGGVVLATYRDPLGGRWLALAALPIEKVAPTPFQRDLSDAHAKRLEGVIEKVGTFLDPIVAVPAPDDVAPVGFWTPNGLHRWTALNRLGAKTITVLLSPDVGLAYRILALNTEKAHNTKERALEAMRMAKGLAELDPGQPESAYALELEDGYLVTLGFAYDKRARLAGGAYAPALKASDVLLEEPLPAALEVREAWAERLLHLDERVAELVTGLKERGFDSPYLRNFVVARLRPFRAKGKATPDVEGLLDHMESAASKFDVAKIRADQIAKTAGGAE